MDKKLALRRFSVAEDLSALGFVFLQLLLGALSGEDDDYFNKPPPSPPVTVRDLERQVEEVFRGADLLTGMFISR